MHGIYRRHEMFFDNYEAKRDLANESKIIFNDAIENYLQLFKLTSNNKYLESAFLYAQKYNSFQLREQLSEKKP
ncbi:MAG: hypothetical protein IPO92_24345 [Saprospiraceae bacterium]|nr:hypothetical protein [Saprospiraceae bacterium]